MGDTTTNRSYRIPASTDTAASLTDYWRNLGSDIDVDMGTIFGAWTDGAAAGTAWTGSTTNPVIGNGVFAHRYRQVGKTVWWQGIMVAGSTTTFGSGFWQLAWPVTPSSAASTFGKVLGVAFAQDSSAGNSYMGAIKSNTTSAARLIFGSPATSDVTPTVPFTWANGDRFTWSITYEAA